MAEKINKGDIVQIVPGHKWDRCIAVVESVKPWGVQAYVRSPIAGEPTVGEYYIRLEWAEFRFLNAKVFFAETDLWAGKDEGSRP
jgi:hypothetical protein